MVNSRIRTVSFEALTTLYTGVHSIFFFVKNYSKKRKCQETSYCWYVYFCFIVTKTSNQIILNHFQAILLAFVIFVVAQAPIVYVPVEDEGSKGGPLDAIFDLKIKKLLELKEKLG